MSDEFKIEVEDEFIPMPCMYEEEALKGTEGAKEAIKQQLSIYGWISTNKLNAIVSFYICNDFIAAQFWENSYVFHGGYVYPEPEGVHTWISDLMEEES